MRLKFKPDISRDIEFSEDETLVFVPVIEVYSGDFGILEMNHADAQKFLTDEIMEVTEDCFGRPN